MSQLIKGQNGQVYIFAREHQTFESLTTRAATNKSGSNNVLLHIFDSDTHETIKIPQHSHPAQQLLKVDQVKKS